MTYSAVPVETLKSPNHGGVRTRTLGVILHSTRSGVAGRVAEYHRTVNYMMKVGTVSSHRVIGVIDGEHAQLVDDDLVAWHAQEDNHYYLSIEFCQPRPQDSYTQYQEETGIAVVVEWFTRYGIVPGTSTIMPHSGTAQGRRNGKSDPGPLFNLDRFVSEVRKRMGLWS